NTLSRWGSRSCRSGSSTHQASRSPFRVSSGRGSATVNAGPPLPRVGFGMATMVVGSRSDASLSVSGPSGVGRAADTCSVSRPSSAPGRAVGQTRPGGRWRARPLLSLSLRAVAAVVPAACAALAATILGHLVHAPEGPARVWWALWLLGSAMLVALAVERVARRLLPLAVLLQLSLAFPDHAPSRFTMARTAGNVRRLEERISRAKQIGVEDDPARAARQILGLVAALSAHDRKT